MSGRMQGLTQNKWIPSCDVMLFDVPRHRNMHRQDQTTDQVVAGFQVGKSLIRKFVTGRGVDLHPGIQYSLHRVCRRVRHNTGAYENRKNRGLSGRPSAA